MGGKQIRSCSNCRNFDEGSMSNTCLECIDLSNWQTRRGAKAGVGRKPGAGRPKFKDQGEKMQSMILSFKANDVTKAGGYQKVKEYLTKTFYKGL